MQKVATDKVQEILKEVSENHEINIEELTGPSKRGDIALARKDAYKKLEQAGLGPSEIGRALNRDPSTVTRGLVEPPKKCPRGHGPLRRDPEGIAVCITCGYEEPLEQPAEELPAEDPEPKGYEQAVRASQGFRYPEDTKILAVREVEGGADKEEVCKRVGCAHITLITWLAKYGGKTVGSVNANGKNANKIATGRRVRGKAIPEEIKIQAVKEYKAGGDPEEIAKRVGCSPVTIKTTWFQHYGGFRDREASIEVLDGLLRDFYNERGRLNNQLADLNQRISALEMAKRVLDWIRGCRRNDHQRLRT